MSLNAVATNSFFKGLKCPYTGQPITVLVVAHGGQTPMYFSPDAYDPMMPHQTVEDLATKTGTRKGVAGAKTGDAARRCAYTGLEMALTATGGLFSFVGGFSPRSMHRDPYEFARKLHMRDGKLDCNPKIFEKPRIAVEAREPKEEAPKVDKGPSDTALQSVEPLLASKFKQTSVSVPDGVPKRKAK